jgi:hypothetical protein
MPNSKASSQSERSKTSKSRYSGRQATRDPQPTSSAIESTAPEHATIEEKKTRKKKKKKQTKDSSNASPSVSFAPETNLNEPSNAPVPPLSVVATLENVLGALEDSLEEDPSSKDGKRRFRLPFFPFESAAKASGHFLPSSLRRKAFRAQPERRGEHAQDLLRFCLGVCALLFITGTISAVVGRAFVEQQALGQAIPVGIYDPGYVIKHSVAMGVASMVTSWGSIGLLMSAGSALAQALPDGSFNWIYVIVLLEPACFLLPGLVAAQIASEAWGLRFTGVYIYAVATYSTNFFLYKSSLTPYSLLVLYLRQKFGRYNGSVLNNDRDSNSDVRTSIVNAAQDDLETGSGGSGDGEPAESPPSQQDKKEEKDRGLHYAYFIAASCKFRCLDLYGWLLCLQFS